MIPPVIRSMLKPLFLKHISELSGSQNIPQDTGFLVATNHIDYLDGFFLGTALINAGIKDIRMLTVTNNYWWTGGTIAIDPNRKAESLEAAMKALQERSAICMFIEGQRNITPSILPGKTGLARLALRSKAPVLPVGLTAASGNSFMESVRLHLIQGKPYTIRFGTPLIFNELYDRPVNHEILMEVTNRVRAAIGPLCGKTVATNI